MFKVGDKLKCIREQDGCYIDLGQIVKVIKTDVNDFYKIFDIQCDCFYYKQYASSKNFVKVEE